MIKNKKIALIVLLVVIAGTIYYLNSMKVMPRSINAAPNTNLKNNFNEGFNNERLNGSNANKMVDYIQDENVIAKKSLAYQKAPELAGISGYINANSSPIISNLRGKVVLVDFWTYTCINCIRTLPYLKEWDKKYRDNGLLIIGVHTPEFEFEKKLENVKEAVEKYGIKYPVVQDNDYATWTAYQNRYWPHKYLVDIDGFIRYDHIGEGNYEETEKMIQELLNERMERIGHAKIAENTGGITKPKEAVDVDYNKVGTPEIYLGYGFTRGNFGNPEGLPSEKIVDYTAPLLANPNKVYLQGKWKVNKDNVELISEQGKVFLRYQAKNVNVVASSDSKSEVGVYLDTNQLNQSTKGSDIQIRDGKGIAEIKDERLYNLVDYDYANALLELRITGRGFRLYTFTFG